MAKELSALEQLKASRNPLRVKLFLRFVSGYFFFLWFIIAI